MPDYVGGNVIGDRATSFKRYKVGKIGFVDAIGGVAYARVASNGSDMTRSELDALREKCGEISNAGVFYDGIEDFHKTSRQDARAIDDTLGTVQHVAVLVFKREDNEKLEERFEIPAPKREVLQQAGNKWTLNVQAPLIQQVIPLCEATYNAGFPDGEPEYRFSHGLLSTRNTKAGGSVVPNVVDPVV